MSRTAQVTLQTSAEISFHINRSGRFDGEGHVDGPEIKDVVAQLVSTVNTDNVKSKKQDKEGHC